MAEGESAAPPAQPGAGAPAAAEPEPWFWKISGPDFPRGKRTNFNVEHEYENADFLQHYNGPREAVRDGPVQGLHMTRFHRGFQRVSGYDHDTVRQSKQEARESAAVEHAKRRREFLSSLEARNGFNVMTGAYDPSKHHEALSIRYIGERVAPETIAEGEIQLKQSLYRFEGPQPSGNQHDFRQRQMDREGLTQPRMSSVLGVGRNDTPSYGVEDQFSKSNYTPNEPLGVEGLHDIREPGRYTPRKTHIFDGDFDKSHNVITHSRSIHSEYVENWERERMQPQASSTQASKQSSRRPSRQESSSQTGSRRPSRQEQERAQEIEDVRNLS